GVLVGAVPKLKLFGIVAGGWQLLRTALIAQQRLAETQGSAAAGFYAAKLATARFYADHVLPQAAGLAHSIVHGAAGTLSEGVL
ncbi:MAG: acyl-CoA dehydrogenase C-terminal domain-containing protein, partial [Steroidobacteraceae bacterium]